MTPPGGEQAGFGAEIRRAVGMRSEEHLAIGAMADQVHGGHVAVRGDHRGHLLPRILAGLQQHDLEPRPQVRHQCLVVGDRRVDENEFHGCRACHELDRQPVGGRDQPAVRRPRGGGRGERCIGSRWVARNVMDRGDQPLGEAMGGARQMQRLRPGGTVEHHARFEPQRAGAGPDQGAAGRGFVVHGESLRGGLIRTRPLMPASNSLYVPLTTATTLIVWLTGSTWAPMRCTRAG